MEGSSGGSLKIKCDRNKYREEVPRSKKAQPDEEMYE